MAELTPRALAAEKHAEGVSTRVWSSPPSVCFVAPNAYPALSGREDLTNGGGAERQQVLLAEELSRRDHRVSFVVLDHGQPDEEEIRGIRVVKCYRLDQGIRGGQVLRHGDWQLSWPTVFPLLHRFWPLRI